MRRHLISIQPVIATASMAVLFCFIVACSPQSLPEVTNEYQQRLERVLNTSFISNHDAEPSVLLSYPTKAQLEYIPTVLLINLTEFYQLQQCQLGTLIAQRNTVLGKTMLPSQQLIYEGKLLNALSQCIDHIAKNAEQDVLQLSLSNTLQSWHAQKRKEYPFHWRNMLTLSHEVKTALSRQNANLLTTEDFDISGQLALFRHLTSYRRVQFSPNHNTNHSLEDSLQSIAAVRLPATIWRKQEQLLYNIPPLTLALQQPLQQVDCNQNKGLEQAQILRNVFYLFFIEKIQPMGALINNFHYQFNPLFEQWLAANALPQEFKDYLQVNLSAFNRYKVAMSEHVEMWQGFLARCHLSPQAPKPR